MTNLTLGDRVEVFDGDGSEFLGYGEYVGNVSVYVIVMPDGSIKSLKNAEQKPSDEEVTNLGGELLEVENNPKIVLDNGRVVYGCQVWWQPVSGDPKQN